jgi:hypothetical protein
LLKVPNVTPSGNPTKEGTVVVTPAVPVNGTDVQQWMWALVVVPSSPEKFELTDINRVTSSTVTVAEPVPGDALGGDSAGPDKTAEKVIVDASLVGIGKINAVIKAMRGEKDLSGTIAEVQRIFASLWLKFVFDPRRESAITNKRPIRGGFRLSKKEHAGPTNA